MRRFFVPPENIRDRISIKDKGEIHHLKNVLRLKSGDEVIISDGKGREYRSRINSTGSEGVVLTVIKEIEATLPKITICLACALPKNSKFDFLVEKATEIGVDRIIPLKTKRTIVELKGDRQEKKIKHWQEIAVNASKQSQRNTIPELGRVFNFREAVGETKKYDLALIPCLFGKRKKIEDVLMQFEGKSILVFIGPEGDFTPEEVSLAVKAGCQPVALGERVLKVDSAALYSLSVINFIARLK